MFKIFRIFFAAVAAACAVAAVIVAVNWGMIPFWGCLAGGVLAFAFCLLFKFLQEDREARSSKPDDAANTPAAGRKTSAGETADGEAAENPAENPADDKGSVAAAPANGGNAHSADSSRKH